MVATDGGPGSPQIAKGTEIAEGPEVQGILPAASRNSPATRASDRERDAVLQRVQEAFAEGRLDDTEFDERMRAALTARTRADLDVLLADLPATTPAPGTTPTIPGRGPGRLAIALKGSVRRAGRWRVPERYTTVVYKGGTVGEQVASVDAVTAGPGVLVGELVRMVSGLTAADAAGYHHQRARGIPPGPPDPTMELATPRRWPAHPPPWPARPHRTNPAPHEPARQGDPRSLLRRTSTPPTLVTTVVV